MTNQTQTPLVSVLIPCYNGEDWVAIAVRSALAQTYANIEVIVIDDGSADSSSDVVRELLPEDSRLKLIVQPNAGVSAARNHGIRVAQGEYFAPLDHDDVWSPDKIEKQVGYMLRAQASGCPVGMVYCWSEIIDEAGRIIRKGVPRQGVSGQVFDDLMVDNFIGNGSTPLIQTELARKLGGYDQKAIYGCEDWIFYLMLARVCEVGVVNEYLVGYRQFHTSMSHNTEKMLVAHETMVQILRENYSDIRPHLIRDSRVAMRLWMLYRAPLFSPAFNRMLRDLLKQDAFFCVRFATLRKLCRMFYVRVYRFGRRLGKEEPSRPFFLERG